MTLRIPLFLTLLLAGIVCNAATAAAQDDDDGIYEDSTYYEEYDDTYYEPIEEENEFSMAPQFSRASSGAGLALGFNLTGLKPETLDPDLGGDLLLTNIDAYIMLQGTLRGFLFGGSWTSARLYDPGDRYDEFSFGYSGVLLGYDHSLFYGRMTIRPSILLGSGGITMIKKRQDVTLDTALNPGGREILERIRDQDFYVIRPGFGIGYSPIDLLQFRAEVGFLYPTGDGYLDDLRKPIYSFQVVFGSNR